MTGPCAKVRVFCTLVHPTNGQRYVGENIVRKPQQVCPRGNMPSGMGYDLCINVCDQVGHAEIVALAVAGADAEGCTAYIEGRDYICSNCQSELFKAGVKRWVLGPPPTSIEAVVMGAARIVEAKKEELLTAWLAEHGIVPSEAVVCSQMDWRTGVQRIWVEKK